MHPELCIRLFEQKAATALYIYFNLNTMKYSNVLSFLLLTALAILSACNSDSKPPSIAPPPPEGALPTSPKPEVYLYAVSVEKLNLREESNKNGKVITQFPEGGIVEGSGEISANKEEATLRDIPYNEPYFKVKSIVAPQQSGWAYSAALKPVYAGSRATSPDITRLTEFSSFLKSLSVTKLENGKKAFDYVKTNLTGANGTLADATLILLQNFLSRMEMEGNYYNLTDAIQWADDDFEAIWKETFDMNKYPVTKRLAENGFRLEQGEGMVFPIVDWGQLANFFAGRVTPPMKEYMLQTLAEQKDNAYDDGGIVIGLDILAERAIFWEKFNQQNPYFVLNAETQDSERWLRLIMVNGSDNTPVFDYDTHLPTEDFKTVWALIFQKYPGSKLAKDVKVLNDLLASEGGKRTKKVEDWQMQYANDYSTK